MGQQGETLGRPVRSTGQILFYYKPLGLRHDLHFVITDNFKNHLSPGWLSSYKNLPVPSLDVSELIFQILCHNAHW